MKFEDNPYYSPEQCGLKILHELDTADSYEFCKFVIWQKTDDGTLWWDTDSGCSCPSPFSNGDHGHDLKQIKYDDMYGFDQALKNHSGMSQGEFNKIRGIVIQHFLLTRRVLTEKAIPEVIPDISEPQI